MINYAGDPIQGLLTGSMFVLLWLIVKNNDLF